MGDNPRLQEMDVVSRAFIDFLETSAYIGATAVDPMSETKLEDLYKLVFQPAYTGAKSFNFQDIHQHMTGHGLLRREGGEWLFPTKDIAVPYLESPEKLLKPRRLVLDPRLTASKVRRLVEARKLEPLSFLAAHVKGYEDNAAKLLQKANFPSVVFLGNTGLGAEVVDEDLIWSGYSNLRKSGVGEEGDIMLYYASHLEVNRLNDLESDQMEMLWVKMNVHLCSETWICGNLLISAGKMLIYEYTNILVEKVIVIWAT